MRKQFVAAFATLLFGAFGAALVASPAQAVEPECRTSVAQINNRADRGFGEENDRVWAYKFLKRTTKICQVIPDGVGALSVLERWEYQATVTDVGTFKTVGGDKLSPEKAGPLVGGVAGTLNGGFTARFSAAANFHDYNAKHDGATYTGENPGNQVWVKELFNEEAGFKGDSFGNRWGWTYTTGCETWKDVHAGGDENDITGKVCPTQEPTTPATPDPTTEPEPTQTPGTGGQAGGSGSLPVTGFAAYAIGGIGLAMVLVGGAAILLSRRRRVSFTA